MTTHICLFDASTIANPITNLTPALGAQLRATHVVAWLAPHSGSRPNLPPHSSSQPTPATCKNFQAVLKRYGISSEVNMLDQPDNITAIREQLLQWLVQRKTAQPEETYIANLSGGNRATALAAHEVFAAADLPMFYVDKARDHVVWLTAQEPREFDLQDRLQLEPFLLAHGVQVDNRRDPTEMSESLRAVCRELLLYVDDYQHAVRAMNWFAGETQRRLPDNLFYDRNFIRLCDLYQDAGLLNLDGRHLHFQSEADRFICRGGWLELHCYHTLRQLSSQLTSLQDYAVGVEVSTASKGRTAKNRSAKPVRNECDGLALADNRLHVIECKTMSLHLDSTPHSDAARAIYKLDTLTQQLGGTNATGILLSYFPLGRFATARAKALNLHICSGSELQRLREFFWRVMA